MQQSDGDDEGQEEPIRHIDMRFFAAHQRAAKGDQVENPNHRQPQIHIPFRFGIFLALGDAEHIAKCRHDNDELIAPEQEPPHIIAAEQPGAAGALHDEKAGQEQRISAKGENHRAGMHRAQPPEAGPFQIKIEQWKSELQRNDNTHQESHHPPKGGGDGEGADRAFHHDGLITGRASRRSGNGGHIQSPSRRGTRKGPRRRSGKNGPHGASLILINLPKVVAARL